MSKRESQSRRRYLESVGAVSVVATTGLSGCLGSLSGGGGPIPMASILPVTGQLSAYGEGMQGAANLAADHINSAGGPLDREVSITNRDSETSPDRAVQKYNSLVSDQGIVGFVGAASSGVSTAIAENVADDGVMQVSNASTSPVLAEIGYDGETKYFGRTSPNDGQQGIVMGRILDEYIEAGSAAFLYVDNPYGAGLAEKASEAFSGETVASQGYDPDASDYTGTLDSVFADDPDAVGFVGYPENGRTILQQWDDGGYGGEWVLSEGLNSSEFFNNLQDIVAGMYVASPDPEETDGAQAFENEMGDSNTLFAAHAYDALALQALAVQRAEEASGAAIAQNIRAVSRPEGEQFTVDEFEEAFEVLSNGNAVDYQGASSPANLNESLEPLNQFAILQINDDASLETLETVPRSEFEGEL